MMEKEKIEEFKRKANRPNAWDKDVARILRDCGGDVDRAVSLIKKHDEVRAGVKRRIDG